MDISKIDKNFKEQSVAACDGKATYAIPSKYFSLYGVQYDEKEKCFVRMPLAVAATVNEGVAYLLDILRVEDCALQRILHCLRLR